MIVVVAPYFDPAYKAGGPIKSLKMVCQLFQQQGWEYKVVTRDYDIDGQTLPEANRRSDTEYVRKPRISFYRNAFKEADVIWINSLYSLPFGLLPLLALASFSGKQVLLSPRGQLLPGAVSYSKKLYLKLVKLGLKRSKNDITIHYTNEEDIKKSLPIFRSFKHRVFNNPIEGNINDTSTSASLKPFTIAFFGRIAPIKNIEFIISLLTDIPEASFQIHGTAENTSYKESLVQLIREKKLDDRVHFMGAYDKTNFAAKFEGVTVGVIPSFSENFCHVFFEIIEQRKLVVASDGLPWEKVNAYLPNTVLPLQHEPWLRRFQHIEALTDEEYREEQQKLLDFYGNFNQSVKNEIIDNFTSLIQHTHED
ncbi:glycosyltransferase [Flavobacteriaceae bacterium TK19130]|nr:glycosyltransferase [Thermobacterium salinum]